MKYSLLLHPLVTSHDIPRLDTVWQHIVRDAVREKLVTNPKLYGKPLQHSLKGCRALRVGDYRVVYQIDASVVKIVAIIHRSQNYKGIDGRRGNAQGR